MRIVVLSSYTQSLFWFRLDMMKEMVEKGHQVYAVGNSDQVDWQKQFAMHGIKYYSIRVERNGLNPVQDIHTFFDLLRLIRNIHPNRIFAYQAKTVIYGSIAAYINGINEFYPLIAGLGSIFIGKGIKNKIVRSIMKLEYRVACRISSKVFFQNNDDLGEFVKHGMIKREKAVIINGSGVNIERFMPTAFPETTTFLFIGRLIKDKGVIEYLNACHKIKQLYPSVRCLLVGPFDSNPTSIKKNDLDSFIKSGVIEYFGEQKDVRPYISQTSVFVLPSYHEGTPKTILEAMSMGRPIITTNVPGCRETVCDGLNGFMVKAYDEDDLVEKMEYFVKHPHMIEKMGNRSIEITCEKYDVRKVNSVIFAEMNLIGGNK